MGRRQNGSNTGSRSEKVKLQYSLNAQRPIASTVGQPNPGASILSQHMLDAVLIEKKYIALVPLIKYIQREHPHQNILQLIIDRSLEHFLDKATKEMGRFLVNDARAVLHDFYMEIEKKIGSHQKPVDADNIASQTEKMAVPATKSSTLSDLKQAKDADSLFHLLNKGGWEIGCNLIRDKKWPAVREYLFLLKQLSPDVVSHQLHTIYWGSATMEAGNSFVGRIIESITPPEDIMFDLLRTYDIQKEKIRDMARLPSMKQKVRQYITAISDVEQRIALYKQCLNFNTVLGQFCYTTTSTHGISKFISEYNSDTGTLQEIRDLLKIDEQSFSELAPNRSIAHTDESANHEEVLSILATPKQQHNHTQNFFSARRRKISDPSKKDYFTYAVLIFICIQAAFKIYCSYCKNEQDESTQLLDDQCNHVCSPR